MQGDVIPLTSLRPLDAWVIFANEIGKNNYWMNECVCLDVGMSNYFCE
jgi:hypothetical protein